MLLFIEGKRFEIIDEAQFERDFIAEEKQVLGILTKEELIVQNRLIGIDDRLLNEMLTKKASHFEGHDGYDIIALQIPDRSNILDNYSRCAIYLRNNMLLFICEEGKRYENLEKLLEHLEDKKYAKIALEKVFYYYFDHLTKEDPVYLDSLELEISNIEEALISSVKIDYVKEIIEIRKKLLVLKRYYEQLLEICEAIEENMNELLPERACKYFHNLTNRADRLGDSVANLRDYLSQIREAYQSQVDISQNNIMKLFTVITVIFMPLTLLVGWYGMNFPMPEYTWKYGYPVLIGISILVVAICAVAFKIKKWF